jgi:D-arabinose 1-dehydrogenase-like Zn-dependent alcohol dehydrogenase
MILGHENASWVEEIGLAVESVKVSDSVIGHPIVGILGGTLLELQELIVMADRGLVSLTTRQCALKQANKALRDLKEVRNYGWSVLIP